jgi:hypothetical protein
MPRDYVQEIPARRNRLTSSERWWQVSERLHRLRTIEVLLEHLWPASNLIDAIEDDKDLALELRDLTRNPGRIASEIGKYIPIGLVACMEGFFRLAYADLINHGSPFRENAAKFEVKFSIEMAVSLEQYSVSLGEFVAHLLTTNNLADINHNMTTIVGESFLDRFREMRPQLEELEVQQPRMFDDPTTQEEITNGILVQVENTFTLRHMYCHEIDPIIGSEISSSVCPRTESVVRFIWVSEQIVRGLLGAT